VEEVSIDCMAVVFLRPPRAEPRSKPPLGSCTAVSSPNGSGALSTTSAPPLSFLRAPAATVVKTLVDAPTRGSRAGGRLPNRIRLLTPALQTLPVPDIPAGASMTSVYQHRSRPPLEQCPVSALTSVCLPGRTDLTENLAFSLPVQLRASLPA